MMDVKIVLTVEGDVQGVDELADLLKKISEYETFFIELGLDIHTAIDKMEYRYSPTEAAEMNEKEFANQTLGN